MNAWLWLWRLPFFPFLLQFFFAHMTFAIPAQRLCETLTLVAFYHPRPAYPVHILIVPRMPLSSLGDIRPEHTPFLADLFATVQNLVAELELEKSGYRLIVNGGKYQEVPHLHFHLISGDARTG